VLQTKLIDYAKIYNSYFDKEFCDLILCNVKDLNWSKHEYYDSANDNLNSYEDDLFVYFESFSLKEKLDENIWFIINKYVREDFSYMSDWFNNWNGYTLSRINKYDSRTRMRIHCDHIKNMFDGNRKGIPILTVLGVLNEDYEGGEFMLCGEKIELKTGDVIVFPSNFLYPHEVKPVKSGVRYSFVSWVW